MNERRSPGFPFTFVFALLSASSALGCGAANDARRAELTSVIARADETLIRSRPRLVAGKYARMAASAYDFYRGTVPLSLHDFRADNLGFGSSAFALAGTLVPSLGDPHPENFGTLIGADGKLALEPNDLDGADFAPYLWDVRRLAAGMALAARVSNPDDVAALAAATNASRAIARAAAEGYAEAIGKLAAGAPVERITSGMGNPVLDDVFERSAEDLAARSELDALTVEDGRGRYLRRGALDPEDPTNVFLDVPKHIRAALPEAIARYRDTLLAPPPPEFFTLLDAARELGSGVASWPRVRLILLVRGPTDAPTDDVVLELKELADSGLAGQFPPGVFYDGIAERVRLSSRAAWARPDAEPFWGTTSFLGLVCQIKRESDGQKTVRTSRMKKDRGTPEALSGLARRLGAIVARAHASTPKGGASAAPAIAAAIARDPAGFADEQADIADRYAAAVLVDWELFRDALDDLGPRLGVPFDAGDAPSPDLSALYADDAAP